jgi:CRISPR-associated protein Cas1
MHQLLNTLYVQTPRSYLHLDHETLKVKVEREVKLQVPLHHLGAIVCMGDVGISTPLLHRCAEDGRTVSFFDSGGRFKARLEGAVSGNVLLRRSQHDALSNPAKVVDLARSFVAAKLQNSRQILLRAGRETSDEADVALLQAEVNHLAETIPRLPGEADRYFGVFGRMVKEDREGFAMNGRSRRPPRDRANALLSFLYTLVTTDCVAACEGVGLDPQVGFLHALRPGRPALALDLVEEFRAMLADRLALTLVNRKQVSRDDFEEHPGGGVLLHPEGRKKVVVAYQQRKQEELTHPVTLEKTPLGLLPHVQARLLARHLRGDLNAYPPFLYR